MSWREAADPRCPECGGKISGTASYCMHCHVDLPQEGDLASSSDAGETVLADDGVDETGTEYDTPTDAQASSNDQGRATSVGTELADTLEGFGRDRDRHRLDGFAGRLASLIWTDVPDPEGVPDHTFTAPLWLRFIVGVTAGFFVYMVFLGTSVFLLDGAPVIPGVVNFVGFFVIMWWLIRKPLPSDIVGDACYAIALLLLSLPVAFVVNEVATILLGAADGTVGDTVIFGVFMTLFVAIPATFFFVLGYVGNRYARSKLDRKAEEATGSADA